MANDVNIGIMTLCWQLLTFLIANATSQKGQVKVRIRLDDLLPAPTEKQDGQHPPKRTIVKLADLTEKSCTNSPPLIIKDLISLLGVPRHLDTRSYDEIVSKNPTCTVHE